MTPPRAVNSGGKQLRMLGAVILLGILVATPACGNLSYRNRRAQAGRPQLNFPAGQGIAQGAHHHPLRAHGSALPIHGFNGPVKRGPRPVHMQPRVSQPLRATPAITPPLPQVVLKRPLTTGHRCLRDVEGDMPAHLVVEATAYCTDGQATNMQMVVYKSNDIVSSTIANTRGWERYITNQMAKALRDGAAQRGATNGTLVDIGANVGWYTMHMATCGHNVIAVEPFRENANLIQAGVCLNGLESKVKLLRYGLGTEDLECAMISGSDNHGDGISVCHMRTLVQWAKAPGSYALIGTMEIRTLDGLLEAHAPGATVDVLKIDVEGHELNALKGGQGLLSDDQRAPPVLFSEFAPGMMRAAQSEPGEYVAYLRGLGYELCKLRESMAPWRLPEAGEPMDKLLATDGIWDLVGTRQAGARQPGFWKCADM